MFKTILATLTLATVIAPAAMAAEVNWNHINQNTGRWENIARDAYNQNDFDTMCHAEANMIHIDNVVRQAAPGMAALDGTFRAQTERNVVKCKQHGFSTARTITFVPQYLAQAGVTTYSVDEVAAMLNQANGGVDTMELTRRCKSKFGQGASYMGSTSVPSRNYFVCQGRTAGRVGTL